MGNRIVEAIREKIHASSLSAMLRFLKKRNDTQEMREKFDAFDENVIRIDIVDVREGWDGDVKVSLGFCVIVQITEAGPQITTTFLTRKVSEEWDIKITVSWAELNAIELGQRFITKGKHKGKTVTWKASYALHQGFIKVDAKDGVTYYSKIPDLDEIFGFIKGEKVVENVENLIAEEEAKKQERKKRLSVQEGG